MRTRHLSVWIEAPADTVYAYAADPRNLTDWAAGLAGGGLRETAQGWVADSPMGVVSVEFAEANTFGVLDHVVRLPAGDEVYNPMRVIPGGDAEPGCEVVFTVRQRPGVSDDEFEADATAVAADLQTLRRLLES